MRYIDADALMEWAVKIGCDGRRGISIDDLTDAIEDAPSIAPVKHGKWIVKEKVYLDLPNDSDYRYECSLCGWEDQHNEKMIVPYCWHCGARME